MKPKDSILWKNGINRPKDGKKIIFKMNLIFIIIWEGLCTEI